MYYTCLYRLPFGVGRNYGDLNIHDWHEQLHSLAMFLLAWILQTSRTVVFHLQYAQKITQDANFKVQVTILHSRDSDSVILRAHFETHYCSPSQYY